MAPDKHEKAKKRKRHTDDLSKPKKRVAIEDDREVNLSLRESGKWAPVVVSSGGVAIPTSVPLEPWTKPRKKGDSRPGQTSISTTELVLQSSAHPKLDYIAQEEEKDTIEPIRKHYIGIYDPETGNLDVIEARKMELRGAVRTQTEAARAEFGGVTGDDRTALGQAFGTRKSKKAIASFTENAITPDMAARAEAQAKSTKANTSTNAMMGNISETTAAMSTRQELAEAADAAKPRPKRNPDATEIQDVYTIDNLIGEAIMKLVPVRPWMEALKANENVTTTSKFVASRLARVSTNVEKLKILRYMYLLIQIYDQSKRARSDKRLPKREEMRTIAGDMPEAVVGDFKRRFTEGSLIPKFKADLLVTHLCALACLVDNFMVDVYDLQVDLKMESKEMTQYFKEIGAKIGALSETERKRQKLEKAAAAQHRVAKLKLPLEFPQIAFGRATKK